jgi:hypothetical protein
MLSPSVPKAAFNASPGRLFLDTIATLDVLEERARRRPGACVRVLVLLANDKVSVTYPVVYNAATRSFRVFDRHGRVAFAASTLACHPIGRAITAGRAGFEASHA